MTEDFRTPVDIGNRALQHLGVTRMTAMDDNSKNAAAVKFVYDKLRKSELRRNVWRFAIRRVALRPCTAESLELTAPAWDATKTYTTGSLVSYSGNLYYARQAVGLNVIPSAVPASWMLYFGPLTVNPWEDGTAYYAGELVYTPNTEDYVVYLSLQTGNEDDPTEIPAWDATITYNKADTVTYAAATYQSTVELNLNNTPGVSGWELIPATQPQRRQSRKWLRLMGAVLTSVVVAFPLTAGPLGSSSSRRMFRLPNGYLREAPQAPKQGNLSYLGASTSLPLNDWEYEGNYLLASEPRVIVYRFVADVADVPSMDPMFCEGLSARIALELCEELTQSSDKLRNVGAQYRTFMGEARTINGIETGATQPPEDEYITVRN